MNETESTPTKKSSRPGLLIGGVLLLALVLYGVKTYAFSKSHEVTDNAAVAGDVVQVAPLITGTVKTLLAHDNQEVKAGELLFTLDDERLQVALQQAQANLASALADAKVAGADVRLTAALGAASVTDASGVVEQANGGVGTAQSAIVQAQSQLKVSKANVALASSDLQSAQMDVRSAQLSRDKATQAKASAEAGFRGAQSAVGIAQAALTSANATSELARKEYDRAAALVAAGAMPQSQLDRATASRDAADANVLAARNQLLIAQSTLQQRQADLDGAKLQVTLAETAIKQAQLKVRSSQERVSAASSSASITEAQLESAQRGLTVASGKRIQSQAQQATAQTTPDKVEMKKAAQQQAEARVEQARAAVAAAEIDLKHAQVFAPITGRISKRNVQIGSLAQAGATALSIVPDSALYVVANFKETQVAHLSANLPAEITIDGLPGRSFHGHIDSSSAATGSTFALLPPDNATGNFVKVVQRVPVKVLIDDGQPDLDRIRVGMSADVTVALQP